MYLSKKIYYKQRIIGVVISIMLLILSACSSKEVVHITSSEELVSFQALENYSAILEFIDDIYNTEVVEEDKQDLVKEAIELIIDSKKAEENKKLEKIFDSENKYNQEILEDFLLEYNKRNLVVDGINKVFEGYLAKDTDGIDELYEKMFLNSDIDYFNLYFNNDFDSSGSEKFISFLNKNKEVFIEDKFWKNIQSYFNEENFVSVENMINKYKLLDNFNDSKEKINEIESLLNQIEDNKSKYISKNRNLQNLYAETEILDGIIEINGYVINQVNYDNEIVDTIASAVDGTYKYGITLDRSYNEFWGYGPGDEEAVLISDESLFEEMGPMHMFIKLTGSGKYTRNSFEVTRDEYRSLNSKELEVIESFESIENQIEILIMDIAQLEDNAEYNKKRVLNLMDFSVNKETEISKVDKIQIDNTDTNIFDNLSFEEKRKFNIFFSNFSEVYFGDFDINNYNADDLFGFSILHNIVNNSSKINYEGYNCKLQERYVQGSINRFFGMSIPNQSFEFYEYKDGSYIWPAADGEKFSNFSQVEALYDLGNNKYKVDFSIYDAGDRYLGNDIIYKPKDESWGSKVNLKCKETGEAIVKKLSNGKYNLLKYTINNSSFDDNVGSISLENLYKNGYGQYGIIKTNIPVNIFKYEPNKILNLKDDINGDGVEDSITFKFQQFDFELLYFQAGDETGEVNTGVLPDNFYDQQGYPIMDSSIELMILDLNGDGIKEVLVVESNDVDIVGMKVFGLENNKLESKMSIEGQSEFTLIKKGSSVEIYAPYGSQSLGDSYFY